jgi:hypothetical protein
MVEFSGLARLGKVAGVLGVALGVIALVVHEFVGGLGLVPENARPGIVLVISIAAALLIALAIAAYAFGTRSGSQVAQTTGNCSPATNTDKRKGADAAQKAKTGGDSSPATNVRG